MRVLLIEPFIPNKILGAGDAYLLEPLALETVAAAIPHHEVKILDMRLTPNLKFELNSFKPEIVGVTAYTPAVYIATNILQKVKEHNRDILTVIGGHHATLLPEDFNKDFVDVVVIGEGQNSFQEIVDTHEKGKDFREIDGLALPQNGKLFFTKKRGIIMNLDNTPLPDRNLTRQYRNEYFRGDWRPVASIMTSRGCPYRCNFCSVWKHEQGKYRALSPERVVKELESIEEKYVSFSDDNFFQDHKRAEKIYELSKERKIKKIYKLIGRSDTIANHPEIIEKWREIGLEIVIIGFESIKDADLKLMNKHSTVYNNNETIRVLRKNNVAISGHFVVQPDYIKEDFDDLLQYVQNNEIEHPVFCILTPLPGTDLYEEKKNQLLTNNYEMFDLLHVILPTRLHQKEFYKLFVNLYKKCYFDTIKDSRGFSLPDKVLEQMTSEMFNTNH